MKIYGYYVDVPQLNPEDEIKLTLLWRERWSAVGAEPVVLNEWHARQHPLFDKVNAAVSELPTTNPQDYERACYLRWMALAQCGGGFMSDFDVIPYGPNDGFLANLCIPMAELGKSAIFECLHMFASCCPALVYASGQVCERIVQRFADGHLGLRKMGDKDHYSDQYSIEDIKEGWVLRYPTVKGYMDEGWETAPAVHYSNSVMGPQAKQPRYQHIPLLRA